MGSNSWTCKNLELKTILTLFSEVMFMNTPDVLVSDEKFFLTFNGRKHRLLIGTQPFLFFIITYKELGPWLLLGTPLPSTLSAGELFPGHGAHYSTLIFTVDSKGILFTLLPTQQTGVSLVL